MYEPQNLIWTKAVPFCIAAILFVLGATTAMDVPGVYMDSVNPDYIVVSLFNTSGLQMPVWVPPGALLFDRFPIISGIYSGATSYYLGLPFYALFGTGIVGIRLTHMMFGLMVLACTAVLLAVFRVRPLIAGLCLALMALDPAFLFIFRTQFYFTTMPIGFVFLSIALVKATRMAPTPAVAFIVGMLAGASCYSYFIYLFFVPTVAVFAWVSWRDSKRLPSLILFAGAGFSLLFFPYFFVFGRMIWDSGLFAFVAYMKGTVNSVTPLSSGLGLNGRIALFWEYLNYTIVDVGPTSMMLNEFVRPVMADSKAIAVIGLPVLVLLLGIFFGRLRHDGLYIVAGLTLGLFVLVLVFGNRLWLHHYSPILPVLYVGLTIAIDRLVALYRHPTAADAVVVALLMPYGLANAASRQEVFTRLEATGGVGLSSDAIVRYAQDSLREPQSIVRVFPDWGLFMPFEMITRGLRPLVVADSPADSARSLLCSGRDVEVALITRSSDQRIDQWTEQIRWSMPTISHYNQRDGKSVLTVARWKSTNCADK